jgi:hypothetical protein
VITLGYAAIGAVAVAALVTVVAMHIALVRLREFRTDLRPEQHYGEGRSWAWQLNVTNPDNYNPAGSKRLRVFMLLQLLLLIWFALGIGLIMWVEQ